MVESSSAEQLQHDDLESHPTDPIRDFENPIESGDSRPQRKPFSLRSIFQFRLWMLLLLFIPVGLFLMPYGNLPELSYIEDKDLFWSDGMTELDFMEDPAGVQLKRSDNIDKTFQSLGVTFRFGLPLRDPDTENDIGSVEPTYVPKGIRTPAGSPLVARYLASKNQTPATNSKNGMPAGSPLVQKYLNPPKARPAAQNAAHKKRNSAKGYIGISGYPFKFPNAKYASTIACFEPIGTYTKRFTGSITIRFHKPTFPDIAAGVHKVGFFAGRLNHAEALEVRVYGMSGNLLCRQSNTSDEPCVFMSFKSTKRISRIELETIGMDEDYAITGVMFDEVR